MCLLTSTSLCLDKIPALEYNNIVSGNVGMADEQDSDSCVGYHVWVQVPFSALYFMNWCYLLLHQFFYSLKKSGRYMCSTGWWRVINLILARKREEKFRQNRSKSFVNRDWIGDRVKEGFICKRKSLHFLEDYRISP